MRGLCGDDPGRDVHLGRLDATAGDALDGTGFRDDRELGDRRPLVGRLPPVCDQTKAFTRRAADRFEPIQKGGIGQFVGEFPARRAPDHAP